MALDPSEAPHPPFTFQSTSCRYANVYHPNTSRMFAEKPDKEQYSISAPVSDLPASVQQLLWEFRSAPAKPFVRFTRQSKPIVEWDRSIGARFPFVDLQMRNIGMDVLLNGLPVVISCTPFRVSRPHRLFLGLGLESIRIHQEDFIRNYRKLKKLNFDLNAYWKDLNDNDRNA